MLNILNEHPVIVTLIAVIIIAGIVYLIRKGHFIKLGRFFQANAKQSEKPNDRITANQNNNKGTIETNISKGTNMGNVGGSGNTVTNKS